MSPRLDGAREASLSRWLALTPFILQKSRMRRTRTYGSVRGALSDGRPYRASAAFSTRFMHHRQLTQRQMRSRQVAV